MGSKKVIAVTGMAGSGKSTFVEMGREEGYDSVVMGDVVREETARRGLEPTPRNIGRVMLSLREEEGESVIAKRCIPKIRAAGDVVWIDGVKSLYEVEEFKRVFSDLVLVAIHASPKTRFKRLFGRKRSDDPESWELFLERDRRELGVGVGNVIALADYMIVNEGPKGLLRRVFKRFLKEVICDGKR